MPSRICSKCNQQPAKVMIATNPRCESCFKTYMFRTFKTNIGRINQGTHDEKIAVAISGGEGSAAVAILQSQYHDSLNIRPGKQRPKIVLIHVLMTDDDADVVPSSVRSIHQYIPGSELTNVAIDSTVWQSVNQIRDLSDRLQMRRQALFNALASKAEQIGCEAVVLGTSVTRSAARVLESIITARGTRVKTDASMKTDVNMLSFIKPLSNISIRLLVRYAHIEMPHIHFIQHDISKNSLQHVVESFVCQVGDDNYSCVHNVVKVANRLNSNRGVRCAICGDVVLRGDIETNGNDVCGDDCGCDGCECESGDRSALCAGCQACVHRADGVAAHNAVLKLANRAAMRKEIEQFLL